jgi:phage tail sheath protein FI
VTTNITAGTSLANPVVASLVPVLERLLGHAVVSGPTTSYAAWLNWRETIQSSRVIPLASGVAVGAAGIVQDAAPRVIGIGVRRDHAKEGRPFHSWANQPIQGIVGPSRAIGFSLTDGSTEGQIILSHNGGVILRGEAGVETAIASGGFVFVGTDNASADDLWRFYNVTRGRDYIHLMFLKTLRTYLGRFNLTVQTIEAVQNTIKLALRNLQADGDILGFKVGFVPDQNSPEELRLGKFTVDFQAEEAPVLRHIALRSMRYRPALDALLGELMAQIDASA